MPETPPHIRPWPQNPAYWEYKSRPVLLLGGSVEDNLYQIPDIEEHLDTLAACGGNYVRCTMSCRDAGNVWWFKRGDDGLYDLEQPGKEHWRRFQRFLELCFARDIIVQFEVWDRFDFAREVWQDNPYNPRNNRNYTAEESGLATDYPRHPGQRDNPFFRALPELDHNPLLLRYQHAQVDRMLSISLPFPNTLYCMDNETNESPAWGRYWSDYIRRKAADAGVRVCTTEMWDAHDVTSEMHHATWKHPETYDFCDISQNNHSPAHLHWERMQAFRQLIHDTRHVRPINTVKIYGANTGRYGTGRDAQERFWRNIFGGLAATRFHRPPSGLGLSERAQRHIRSMRMLTDEMDVFAARPARELLSNLSYNEACCFAHPGCQYALFFPDGGDVVLDLPQDAGPWQVRWLEIVESRWQDARDLDVQQGKARVATPRDEGYWACLVTAK